MLSMYDPQKKGSGISGPMARCARESVVSSFANGFSKDKAAERKDRVAARRAYASTTLADFGD